MKDLVLGTAVGYDTAQLAPFLNSLEQSGFVGDVGLFASRLSPETLAALERRRLVLIPVHPRAADGSVPIVLLRLPLYRWFLAQHRARYRHVMLSDIRDVVFQRDPFAFDLDGRLCGVLEDARMTLGSCPFNSVWLRDAFGDGVLHELANHPISCAGTVFGPLPRMLDYLDGMLHHLERLRYAGVAGTDQAIHNYVVRRAGLSEVRLLDNDTGPVLTMGYMEPASVRSDDQGRLLNGRGDVAHVIHQYDRHPEVARHFSARFGDRFS